MRRPPSVVTLVAPFVAPIVAPMALGLAAYHEWSAASVGPTAAALLLSLGAASAVCALAFALDAARVRRALRHLVRGGGAFRRAAPGGAGAPGGERQAEQVAVLRRQVDQLSAIRDLALIANDDVDFARVLERALAVLADLLDAREIAIFLKEGPDDGLVPVAHRLGERTRVRAAGGRPLSVEAREAARAVEARRTIVEACPRGFRAATLLVADGEVAGAVEVRLGPASASAAPVSERELARELEGLAKHVALAIRKPTLYDRAVVDSLTRLYTKRHFQEQVQLHVAQRRRLGTPLSLVIVDVDHFKRVNDVHGHVAGDLVLAEVARRLRTEVRGYDQVFRYGGEEMVVLAPNTPLDEAVRLAERLRRRVRGSPFDTGEARIAVTASFGVAELDPETMPDVAAFIARADACLYEAKRNGRDQVRSPASPPLPPAPAPAPGPEPEPVAAAAG